MQFLIVYAKEIFFGLRCKVVRTIVVRKKIASMIKDGNSYLVAPKSNKCLVSIR